MNMFGHTDVVVSGDAADFVVGQHVKIDHYEVAIGTDRRYPVTRTNVLDFTSVDLNLTSTFSGLVLTPQTVTYYTTVRAYSVASTMVEATSNGIRGGFGMVVISNGTLELPRLVPVIS